MALVAFAVARLAGPPELVARAPSVLPTQVVPVTAAQSEPSDFQAVAPAAATAPPTVLVEAGEPVAFAQVAQLGGGSASGQAGGAPALAPAASAVASPSPASTPSTAEAQPGHPFVSYRVVAGDTMESIAIRYGVSPRAIAQASGVANPSVLNAGQLLAVPRQPGWLYRVQTGETLEQIAKRRGIAVADIQAASLLASTAVKAGDLILIPDAAERYVVRR